MATHLALHSSYGRNASISEINSFSASLWASLTTVSAEGWNTKIHLRLAGLSNQESGKIPFRCATW